VIERGLPTFKLDIRARIETDIVSRLVRVLAQYPGSITSVYTDASVLFTYDDKHTWFRDTNEALERLS
jgi:hypothetical protein